MKKKCFIFLTFLLLSCSTEDKSGSESLWDFEFMSNMPCDHYQYYIMRAIDGGGTIESEMNYHFQRNDTIMSYNYFTIERDREGNTVLYMSAAASGAYTYDGNNREGEMRYEFHTDPVSGQINSESFGIYENGEMWMWRIADVDKYDYTYSPQCD